MANLLTMADIQAILNLHEQGWRQRRIARELHVDRETVAKYIRASHCIPKPAKAPLGSEMAGDQATEGVERPLVAEAFQNEKGCKCRLENVARNGACVTVEKRGALDLTRVGVSKACSGITATNLTPPRGSRECTRTWNCGAKCDAGY
jgi:hypothetical protein